MLVNRYILTINYLLTTDKFKNLCSQGNGKCCWAFQIFLTESRFHKIEKDVYATMT